jgi:hypothetical protein
VSVQDRPFQGLAVFFGGVVHEVISLHEVISSQVRPLRFWTGWTLDTLDGLDGLSTFLSHGLLPPVRQDGGFLIHSLPVLSH